MTQKHRPIGVLDSGVGASTVALEIQKQLPGEDIIYCGDNDNCPYGNRTGEDIVGLTLKMLDFLKEKDVKAVAVACNTISTLIEHYGDKYDFPIISIIKPVSAVVAAGGYENVGVIATEFTIKNGTYAKEIQKINPNVAVHGAGSPTLAGLVDGGNFDGEQVETEVRRCTDILAEKNVTDIILGCTHYPLVADVFARSAPGVGLIDPAGEQVLQIKAALEAKGELSQKTEGTLEIYTSGDPSIYRTLAERIGLKTTSITKTKF